MAVTHIHFGQTNQYGNKLRSCMQQLEDSCNGLNELIGMMSLMLNGDGTQDAHYTDITAKFAFESDAFAHAALNELLALQAKLNVNTSVTNVRTALEQAWNKFR